MLAFPAAYVLIERSRDSRALTASLVFSASLVTLYGISALYHRPQWSPRARALMRRLDHAAIFIMIAGTTTAVGTLSMKDHSPVPLLALMWTGAGLGILKSLFWKHPPKWVNAAIYVAIGCLAAPFLGELYRGLGSSGLTLLLAGALMYVVGAVIYALRRPDPLPSTFGYHEIFHAVVIAASSLHFMVVLQLVESY